MKIASKSLLLSLTLLLLLIPAFGRIGESPQECKSRYGVPVKEGEEILIFKKSGFEITISFFREKADLILYKKMAEFDPEKTEAMSDNEIFQMMNLNNPQEWEWVKISGNSMHKAWQTTNEELFSRYHATDHVLVICTKGYMDREAATRKAKEDAAINGL